MNVRTLHRRRPMPAVATVGFALALVATATYFAGLVPGVPKTLQTFTELVAVTVALFVATVLAWVVSLAEG